MVIYASAFAVVPAHLLVIVTSILGSNHVTYRFGKGLTPPAYRLNSSSAAAIKDVSARAYAVQRRVQMLILFPSPFPSQQFAAQFADTYGPAALASLLSRTRLPHSESETPSSWPARRPSHVSLALAPSTSSPESSNSHASFVGGSGAGARKGGAQGHGHGKEQYPVPILDPVPPSAARAPAHASAHPQARAPISYAQGGLGSPFTQDVPAFASTVHAADDDEEDEEEEDDDDDDEEAEEEEAPKKARSDVSANPPELRRR